MKRKYVITNTLLFFVFLLSIFLSSYSGALAAPVDSRWKLYNSVGKFTQYYDTKTIEYDPSEQIAKVWTLHISNKGRQLKMQELSAISFKYKALDMMTQSVEYNSNGEPIYRRTSEAYTWQSIPPDTPFETLANSVASELHIQPIYQGGPDRWKWLHSTDTYGLYVAKDTIVYDPDLSEYSIWTKKLDLNGQMTETLYSINFADKTIWIEQSTSPWIRYDGHHYPIPESDEEYIYNAVKDLAQNLK